MASLDKMEGTAIKAGALILVFILAVIGYLVYVKGKSIEEAFSHLLSALVNFLGSAQANLNDFLNSSIDRLQGANYAGTNVPGDRYGSGGQFDIATGITASNLDGSGGAAPIESYNESPAWD